MGKFWPFRRNSSKDGTSASSIQTVAQNVEYQNIIRLQDPDDGFIVEYELAQIDALQTTNSDVREKIVAGLNDIELRIQKNEDRIQVLRAEEERLTNHADGLDYTLAVASGIISGVIDAVWVGEFSIERANQWGNEKIEDFVVKMAQLQGYEETDLYGAVRYLEDKAPIAADKVTNSFGGGYFHHLRDFSHHPTPVGLLFSLLTQFTGRVYGTDVAGKFQSVPLSGDDLILIGNNMPEKLQFGVIKWFFHMASDMAGSSTSIHDGKYGTGLPGPLVSLLKEASALPIFHNTNQSGYKEVSVWISKLFDGTLLAKRDRSGNIIEPVKFDLRTEIGITHELGRQAVPVIINECIVRAFYLIRRFVMEYQRIKDLKRIHWENVLPIKNRTIARMLTISTGTFMAVDMADAAIRSAVKSGGNAVGFASSFVLRVNFVGIGRFVIALGTDIGMEIQRQRVQNEQIQIYMEQIHLCNARVFYKQADMWLSAKEAGLAIRDAYQSVERAVALYDRTLVENDRALTDIQKNVKAIKKKNAGLIDDILEDL